MNNVKHTRFSCFTANDMMWQLMLHLNVGLTPCGLFSIVQFQSTAISCGLNIQRAVVYLPFLLEFHPLCRDRCSWN